MPLPHRPGNNKHFTNIYTMLDKEQGIRMRIVEKKPDPDLTNFSLIKLHHFISSIKIQIRIRIFEKKPDPGLTFQT